MSRTLSTGPEGYVVEEFARYLVEHLGWPWDAPTEPKPPRSITDAIGDYLWYDAPDDVVNQHREEFADDRHAFLDWISSWEF